MAGRGSRLRPHTLTIPKPLIPVAGKPIVHRLVEDIAGVLNQDIEEIAFIIHESFGKQVEADLIAIAEKLGSKGTIYYQNEALGTGHAIMCAKDSLSGPAVIAYADTLIRADFDLDQTADSVIWVKQVDQPEAFGVINLNEANEIVPASVLSGTLGIDFGAKTYATQLSMSAEGTGIQIMSQSGSINPSTGVFLGGSAASNASSANNTPSSSLAGAIALDARQAGYLFKNQISRGAFIGATLWGR